MGSAQYVWRGEPWLGVHSDEEERHVPQSSLLFRGELELTTEHPYLNADSLGHPARVVNWARCLVGRWRWMGSEREEAQVQELLVIVAWLVYAEEPGEELSKFIQLTDQDTCRFIV